MNLAVGLALSMARNEMEILVFSPLLNGMIKDSPLHNRPGVLDLHTFW